MVGDFHVGLGRFGATLFACCLMGYDYHVVMQTHWPDLSRTMCHINGVYTQAGSRRHRKAGRYFRAGSRLYWWAATQ